MNKNTKYTGITFLAFFILMASCKKDQRDPTKPQENLNEEELITTFIIQFTDSASLQPAFQAIFRDIDGEGGNPPSQFDTIFLHSSTTYNAEIILLDESSVVIDTISNEVLEEGSDHLFCFSDNTGQVHITRTDSDGQYEIGLMTKWVCGATTSGIVTATLRHQPGIKDGTCDPGDTDVEIAFPIIVGN